MNFNRNLVERVRQQYPVGTRIRLDSLCNEERDMYPGLCGTVVGVDDQPALLMKWDNGRSLSLLYGMDSFSIVEQTPEEVINKELYKKLERELKAYKDTLSDMPLEKVLEKAWEYVIRQDILEHLDVTNLDYSQAEALLKLPNTMGTLAQEVMDQTERHMDLIHDCIEEKADELAMEQSSQPEQTM